jgi:uncharacterized caspase-like protein
MMNRTSLTLKRFLSFVVVSLAICLVLLPGTALAAASERRVALVIGNANYAGVAKLRNPANDARAMTRALTDLGFDVIERIDATQKETNRAIAQFGEKLDAGTTAVFYYAGHGMQVRGKNYLIPVDAEISSESAVRTETVDVDVLLDQFATRSSTLNVVILDACRNNPFERKFRSTAGGGLAQIEAPEGTMIAYATAPGKVASDGTGDNGLFTQELLKAIRQPGRAVEQVFKDVRRNVMKATGGEQTPWESSSLTGDFYFAAPSSTVAGTEVRQPPVVASSTTGKVKELSTFNDSMQPAKALTPSNADAQSKAEIEKKLRDFVNAR